MISFKILTDKIYDLSILKTNKICKIYILKESKINIILEVQ